MAAEPDVKATLEQIAACAARSDLEAAEPLCRQLLQQAPQEPEAWSWLGLVLTARGRMGDAELALRQAIGIAPRNGHYWNYLSVAVRLQGRAAEAEAWARQAIALDAQHATYWLNLGAALNDQRKPQAAADAYRQAVGLYPHDAAAWRSLAVAEHEAGRLDAAQAAFEQSLAIAPEGEAAVSYAFLLSRRGQSQRAIEILQKYLARMPQSPSGWMVLSEAGRSAGDMELAESACRRALRLPQPPEVHSNLLFSLAFYPGFDAAAIYEEHKRWNERHALPLADCIQHHANDCDPNRRLRVGYVSPNFWNHCQAFFMAPLLPAHDRSRFEIVCYSDVTRPDEITACLQSRADQWRSISDCSDEQVAALVRDDKIDILVDLTMHMEHHRLLAFARRPAPVQVSWLAYPGTTGMSAIDYRLTDPQLDPLGLFERYYSEESVRLPDSFWCYDPLDPGPEINPLPASKKSYVTFGSLNNPFKVNAAVLKLWARVLKIVARSRLLLLAPAGEAREHILGVLAQAGIAPERIQFVGLQPRLPYLRTYYEIDIGLDTLPYNGHTTSLDAYWMGVPVVTLPGQTVVGRAGVSQLKNLGLPELIATTPDEYVKIAAELAGDLERVAGLRASLRSRMQQSPLMDSQRFARNIESAYRQMWQRWCLNAKSQ